jgi:DNA-binding Lrp family transcriptional regulator
MAGPRNTISPRRSGCRPQPRANGCASSSTTGSSGGSRRSWIRKRWGTVGIDGSDYYADFVRHALETPEILQCHAVTGGGSHILEIRTNSTSTLERLLARIQSWPGVSSTTTSVVLSSAKETTMIVLEAPPPEEGDDGS